MYLTPLRWGTSHPNFQQFIFPLHVKGMTAISYVKKSSGFFLTTVIQISYSPFYRKK